MDQDQVPYVDALSEHAARNPARLTVPGHKGGVGADPAMLEALGQKAFDMDLPALIEGIDVGPPDPNPFEQAQRLAADAWGAARTWFLVGGASQGNHAALLALRHTGRSVVMQRNVHSSAIDGSVLADLVPTFIAPEIDPELGVAHCPTPAALEAALDAAPDAVGALVVSPTYFGACADIAALVEICHSRGLPLIVDEAWGAHLTFSEELPQAALAAGADLVISSTHKIIGSLTQSAMIHLGHESLIDGLIVDRVVTLLESTSPSSLLTLSLDAARRMAAVHGAELITETLSTLEVARQQIREIPGLDVLDERIIGSPGVAGWDPLRLTVDVRGTRVTGHEFADLAFDLGMDYELATETVVVFTFGMGGSAAALADRLLGSAGTGGRRSRREGEGARGPVRRPAAVGAARDEHSRRVPGSAGSRAVRRGRGPDRMRVAGRLPAGNPQRFARRAPHPRDPRLHLGHTRPRRKAPRRQRPYAGDRAGGDRMRQLPTGASFGAGALA